MYFNISVIHDSQSYVQTFPYFHEQQHIIIHPNPKNVSNPIKIPPIIPFHIQFSNITAHVLLPQPSLYNFIMNTRQVHSERTIIIKTNYVNQAPSQSIYQQYDQSSSFQSPSLLIYEALRSIIRRHMCKPFQLFKQFLLFPEEDEDSIQVGYRHMKYEIEIVGENIRNVCTLFRQRLLVQGFITIKNAYFKRLRVERAYYDIENITKTVTCLHYFRNVQNTYLKWQGFGRLYENYKGMKLSKLNLSKIQIVNSGYTSNFIEDFPPLITDRGNQIEAINSYIIDQSQEEEESFQRERMTRKKQVRNQVKIIEQYQSIQDHLRSADKRYKKKTSTPFHQLKEVKDGDDLQEKVLITHRKEIQRKQAGSTNRHRQNQQDCQQLYLIRDYTSKETPPTKYIKVPVLSQNIKIVELQTSRKKPPKKRTTKEQHQLQRQICQNCKYCLQTRQRKQILQVIQQRFQYITIHKQSTSTQVTIK